ncbi:MAG: carboxylesterase/lipase family protein [Eubacteriales bacterium]|nr:carboxylesterase/lipase family protein [Eubacteriales bacterium]MDD3504568.1 carboxylesterase/lipase family protein [Eubacteriales bacterium]
MFSKIVMTKSGKIQGVEQDGQIAYLGIPYAKPPVGSLRLKRAVPIDPWTGVYQADKYGSASVQFNNGNFEGSEDCLTLNIRRPTEGRNMPVLVYIHGGGYNIGKASDKLYEGNAFVKEGIVYVAFQYRLSVWGFYDFTSYKYGRDFDSNCGISDHIAAMKWIHENIEAFGGDPSKITIAGESAGGTSTMALMAIPELKGTFQQVICSSGLPNCVFSKEMARQNIDLFLEGMNWSEEDLHKLKQVDACDVLRGNEYVAQQHQYRNPGIFLPTVAIDDLVPERPIEAIQNGSAEGVRLMIGTNLHEGTMFVRSEKTNFPNSWEMIEEMFRKNGHIESLPPVKEYYSRFKDIIKSNVEMAFVNFATDYAFQMPAIKVAEAQRSHGLVWMYRFEFISKMAKESGMLSAHAMDLPCAFDCADSDFGKFMFGDEPKNIVDKIVEDVHMSWVNFIKQGKPGSEGTDWPNYEGYNSLIRIFDRETRTVQLDRSELMQVWSDMKFYEA